MSLSFRFASIAIALAAILPLSSQAQQRALTVYSSLDEDQAKALIKAFEIKHPSIKVNAILGSTAPIIARVIAESASPQADVILGNAVSALMAADARGLLLPFKPSSYDKVAPLMRDNRAEPVWVGIDAWASSLCFNTAEGAKKNIPAPTSWMDLTKPIYKGQITMPSHYDVRPDVVVLGKALGGGILPIAAVLAHKHMAVAPELTLGHYTHEKNPVTSRAALTTIEIIEDERLVEQAERLGQYTATYLKDRLKEQPLSPIGEVRGLGLMLALTLQHDKLPVGVSAEDLVKQAMQRGVSTTSKDAMAIGFSPPLVISEQEVRLAIDRIVQAAATQGPP